MVELYKSKDPMVSAPSHYQLIPSKNVEVLDVIEAATDGLNGIYATDTGNILKYACRWHKKNGKQDVEKIIYYATHLLRKLEEAEEAEQRTIDNTIFEVTHE